MKPISRFALILVQVLTACCQFTPVLDSATESYVAQILEHWESPTGIAISVVRRDGNGQWLVETQGYGPAKLDGSKNVTADTRFGIGSNSKLFTATATGLLTHDARISPPLTWDSKMKDLVPGWGLVDEVASNEARVQDLLSHRTGVPRHDAAIRKPDTTKDLIRKVRNHRPAALFRDIWQYNNNMYKIIATLPSTLLPSHQPLARYVKENILDKLGLDGTTYAYAVANTTGDLADGIAREVTGGKAIPHAIPYWLPDSTEDGDIDAGDGGVISTANDIAVWLQAFLLNGANPKTNQSVIPPDVVQRLATGFSVETPPRFPDVISQIVYGAGQEIGSYRGQAFVEHSGACPGYNTVISRYPNANYGIAVFSNDNELGGIIVRIIQYYLADRIFGLEAIDWDARYQQLFSVPSGPPPTPRPANATFPYGDVKKLEGVYNNAGYGKVEFCYVSTANPSATIAGSSKSCNDLRASLPTALPGLMHPVAPTIIAEWNATTVSHLALTHFDGALFNLTAYQNYATGDPSAPYWGVDLGVGGSAETDKGLTGIGLTGVWGSNPGVPEPSGNTPEERAEVWFTRT